MKSTKPFDRSAAVARYVEVEPRLPRAQFPESSQHVNNLVELVDDIDVFVLDGFGVLNVGNTSIPGAVESVHALQTAGKRVLVLTNGATLPTSAAHTKYTNWGFDFNRSDVVSSRDALSEALRTHPANLKWGFSAPVESRINELAENAVMLQDDPATYSGCDGFVLLSSREWTDSRQLLLQQSLQQKSRPVLVGNPDLVAPFETGLSLEPGFFAHLLADADVAEPAFYGKPFQNVFGLIKAKLGDVPDHRIAMVGDTLHTDILGGAAAGWRTVLVTDHGLMRDTDVEAAVARIGIRPDYIARTT